MQPLCRPGPLGLVVVLGAGWVGGCGGPAEPGVPATSIALSQEEVGFTAIGDETQLAATVLDAAGNPVSATVTWTSSSSAVAAVSSLGTVTAAGNGTATITAAAGGATASARVTVSQAAESFRFLAGPVDHLAGSAVAGVRLELADRRGVPLAQAADPVTLALTDTLGVSLTALPPAPLAAGILAVPDFTVPGGPRIGLVLRAEVRGLVAVSGRFDVAAAPDVVTTTGTGGAAAWLLLDGFTAGASANDVPVAATGAAAVGIFRRGVSNEVIAMAPGFVPAVLPDAGWTAGVDTVALELDAPTPLPVTVRLITGAIDAEGRAASDAAAEAADLFRAAGAGIELLPTLVDRTAIGADPQWEDVRSCEAAETLAALAGRTAGVLNVYVVHEANGSSRSGFVCPIGGDLVVVGRGADGGLVAHEIGHALGLQHVDGLPGFDQQNVMASNSGTRREFTAGQILRMHLEPGSLLAQRQPADRRRACGNGDGFRCPRLDLRLGPPGQGAIVERN